MTIYAIGNLDNDARPGNGSETVRFLILASNNPDGVVTLHACHARGEMEHTCTDSNRNGAIDFSGPDRITRTVNAVTNHTELWGSGTVRRTQTYQWPESGPVLVNERLPESAFSFQSGPSSRQPRKPNPKRSAP